MLLMDCFPSQAMPSATAMSSLKFQDERFTTWFMATLMVPDNPAEEIVVDNDRSPPPVRHSPFF